MPFGRTVTVEDVKKILEGGSPNYREAERKINKVLGDSPTDPRALSYKARIYCLMKKDEFASSSEEKKDTIRAEAIKLADAIIGNRNSPKCYKAKDRALQCLSPNDPELLKIRRDALQKALNLDSHALDAKFFINMLNQIDAVINGGTPPKTDDGKSQRMAPVVSFSANVTTGVAPCVVKFHDNSLYITPSSTWTWDFGDGGTSRDQNPTHEYKTVNSYMVTLTVTNDYGRNTKSMPDYINIRSKRGVDSDQNIYQEYQKKLINLVNIHPVVIEKILCEQKLQLKGYLYDAFEGETPKALHILVNCIEEMIPYTIWQYRDDTVIMNVRLDIRKRALLSRGYSEDSIDWGIAAWKNALSPHFHIATPQPEREEADLEFTF